MFILKAELGFAEEAIRTLCAMLCKVIYPIIAWAYDLFMAIGSFEIMKSDAVNAIYQRITMILAIIMVFYVTFEFVKYVITPDKMTSKEAGVDKIVLRMIGVVLLIAFVPQIFKTAYTVQNKLIESDIFPKIFLGKANVDTESFGKGFSANLLLNFYSYDEEKFGADKDCDKISCKGIVSSNYNALQTEGKLPHMTLGINAVDNEQQTIDTKNENIPTALIKFEPFFAVIVGAFIAYMLILYCIDVAARAVQLIYLQIIAPIPIIGFLSPKKDGIFPKWLKQCTTTYLDLFIRISIIYFILLVCNILLEPNTFNKFQNEDYRVFVQVALIMGLLMFARRAPKLLGELFPNKGSASGTFGLKAGERGLNKLYGVGKRVVGTAAGTAMGAGAGLATGFAQGMRKKNSVEGTGKKIAAGVGGALWGATRGTVGGTLKGAWNGSKKGNVIKNATAGAKSQVKSNQRFGNRQENGYGIMDQIGDTVRHATGFSSRVQSLEAQKDPIKRHQEMNEKIKKANSDMTAEAESQVKKGKGRYSGELALAEKNLQNLQENQNLKTEAMDRIRASETYKKRCEEIKNTPGMSEEQIKIAQEEELNARADKEVSETLTKAQKAVKEAKDKAVFDFITNGEYSETKGYSSNARIESIRSGLRTEMAEYNRYNTNSEYAVNQELIETAMMDGELLDNIIKGKVLTDSEGNAVDQIEARDSEGKVKKDKNGNTVYIKYNHDKDGINKTIERDQNKLIGISQHQESIKRQTSGSGIAGDKG